MTRAAAVALLVGMVLSGCLCGAPCPPEGCPEGEACSLVWNSCIEAERVYGPPCFTPDDCHRGVCLTTGDAQVPAVCSGTCGAGDPPCPDGFVCIGADDGLGGVLEVCAPTGDGAIGEGCVSGTDCQGGVCLPLIEGSVCSAFCDATDAASCGGGNVGCVTFEDTEGNTYDFCVAGGDAPPGGACPDGISDCDLTRSDVCLQGETDNFCSPACPNGVEDCADIPGGCCVNLGTTAPAPFCLTPPYCGCIPDCLGRVCGDDGCGGSCGECGADEVCSNGNCIVCTPDCTDRECGDDGCGSDCGTCTGGEVCRDGVCEATCTPRCTGLDCGPDGCGGLCGSCTSPDRCFEGACVDPVLLLIDVVVRDPALSPAELWGLGEYTSPQSIGPPVTYRQAVQPGTTQQQLCGSTIVCSDVTELVAAVPYEVVLGFDRGADRERCTASFTLSDIEPHAVDGGDCLATAGGPFAEVRVTGGPALPQVSWSLP